MFVFRMVAIFFGPAAYSDGALHLFAHYYPVTAGRRILGGVGRRDYLTDLAFALVGPVSGGPAKWSAVISSAMLGCINGNSVANVVTTGSITIPLMKSVGMRRNSRARRGGGVDGGQILPPSWVGAPSYGGILQRTSAKSRWRRWSRRSCITRRLFMSTSRRRLDLKGLAKEQIPCLRWRKAGLLWLPIAMWSICLLVARLPSPFRASRHRLLRCVSCLTTEPDGP
jgi:hypothetical protein